MEIVNRCRILAAKLHRKVVSVEGYYSIQVRKLDQGVIDAELVTVSEKHLDLKETIECILVARYKNDYEILSVCGFDCSKLWDMPLTIGKPRKYNPKERMGYVKEEDDFYLWYGKWDRVKPEGVGVRRLYIDDAGHLFIKVNGKYAHISEHIRP